MRVRTLSSALTVDYWSDYKFLGRSIAKLIFTPNQHPTSIKTPTRKDMELSYRFSPYLHYGEMVEDMYNHMKSEDQFYFEFSNWMYKYRVFNLLRMFLPWESSVSIHIVSNPSKTNEKLPVRIKKGIFRSLWLEKERIWKVCQQEFN